MPLRYQRESPFEVTLGIHVEEAQMVWIALFDLSLGQVFDPHLIEEAGDFEVIGLEPGFDVWNAVLGVDGVDRFGPSIQHGDDGVETLAAVQHLPHQLQV